MVLIKTSQTLFYLSYGLYSNVNEKAYDFEKRLKYYFCTKNLILPLYVFQHIFIMLTSDITVN